MPKQQTKPMSNKWGICVTCSVVRAGLDHLYCGAPEMVKSQKRDRHGRVIECSLWGDGFAAADLAFDAAREGRR